MIRCSSSTHASQVSLKVKTSFEIDLNCSTNLIQREIWLLCPPTRFWFPCFPKHLFLNKISPKKTQRFGPINGFLWRIPKGLLGWCDRALILARLWPLVFCVATRTSSGHQTKSTVWKMIVVLFLAPGGPVKRKARGREEQKLTWEVLGTWNLMGNLRVLY